MYGSMKSFQGDHESTSCTGFSSVKQIFVHGKVLYCNLAKIDKVSFTKRDGLVSISFPPKTTKGIRFFAWKVLVFLTNMTDTVGARTSAPIQIRTLPTPQGASFTPTSMPRRRCSRLREDLEHERSNSYAGLPVYGEPNVPYSVECLAIHPSGKFLYTYNENDNSITGFAIDPSSGALTQVAGSPFPPQEDPFFNTVEGDSMAVDPRGKFLYMTATATRPAIAIYRIKIDQWSGALTAARGFPLTRSWGKAQRQRPPSCKSSPS